MFPALRFGVLVPAAILAIVPASARATTIVVPDEVATIQAALDAAPDTVIVLPGTYAESPVMRHEVVLVGSVVTPPTLAGLDVRPPDDSTATVVGIHVAGLMRIGYAYSIGHTIFRSCVFDSMLNSNEQVIRSASFDHCELVGPALVRGAVIMDSCLVHGGLSGWGLIEWDITSSAFRGTGDGTALNLEEGGLRAIGNTFSDYTEGIHCLGSSPVIFRDNVLHRCRRGVYFTEYWVEIVNNSFEDGASDAMTLYTGGRVDSNLVLRCGRGILVIEGGPVQISGNRIGRCASDAIWANENVNIVTNNTLYLNGGAGLSADKLTASFEVSHNIFYGNASAWALRIGQPAANFVATCNDFYGNGGNPGFPGNSAVDPGFCNVDSDDVHLVATSPLVGGACGLVGALGVGCDLATAALHVSLSAQRVAEGVHLSWDARAGASFTIQRSESADGPWSTIASNITEGFMADRGAAANRDYWYRLVVNRVSAHSATGEAVHVAALVAPGFSLSATSANPTRGTLRVRFSLPRAAAVSIDLLDLQGRRQANVARGEWPAGTHDVTWTNGALPPGSYMIVYEYPGGRKAIRYALLR